ncbi:DUF2478 domain-containing protein [Thioclava atlantica]|uniref:3-dehydroquinate dehydratase n=1 Tax=Thioclava atlantica TaxID=1317124 RepID=A0A085TZX1_9RHOB|nr:DUF2478 domain-containing protein [Thioclava atlantica]KFE36268.1 hypothetical protein DW2_03129 [Thioclava atlantica]
MYPIASLRCPGRGDTDLLLSRFAQEAMEAGLRVRGTVQINTERAKNHACDMDIKVLPDGPVLLISQALGSGSRGCRLNPEALETAVEAVARTLDDGADLLIINKFGKMEAEGRGFREVIAHAIAREIPVLVGLNGLNQDAFAEFTGGAVEPLSPEIGALHRWISAIRETAPTS